MDMAIRIRMVCKNSCQIFEMLFSFRPYKDIFGMITLYRFQIIRWHTLLKEPKKHRNERCESPSQKMKILKSLVIQLQYVKTLSKVVIA